MMKKSQIEFLDLFFNEGEEICVSDSKFSFHSVTRDEIESNSILLKSPPSKKHPSGFTKNITSDKIVLACVNPVKGWKRDENVTAYRSFLIELDDMPLAEQKKYIDESGMPYSICAYSGNKSLHYAIVLDEDLPDYNAWLLFARWIWNIVDKSDPQNSVPTKSFRFPDNVRPDGLKKKQSLVEMRSRITIEEMISWLSKHKDKMPVIEKHADEIYSSDTITSITPLGLPTSIYNTLKALRDGEQDFRNKSWFSLACFMAKKGVTMEETVRVFSEFFNESPDFDRNEWMTSIKSGYKHIHKDI